MWIAETGIPETPSDKRVAQQPHCGFNNRQRATGDAVSVRMLERGVLSANLSNVDPHGGHGYLPLVQRPKHSSEPPHTTDALVSEIRTWPDAEKLCLVEMILNDLHRPDPEIERIWADERRNAGLLTKPVAFLQLPTRM